MTTGSRSGDRVRGGMSARGPGRISATLPSSRRIKQKRRRWPCAPGSPTARSALAEVLYQTVASPTPPPADFTVITEKGEPPSAEELLSELASLA